MGELVLESINAGELYMTQSLLAGCWAVQMRLAAHTTSMDMTVGMERTVVGAAVGTADLSNAHG